MKDDEGGHELCAFALWEANVLIQRLRLESMALRQQLAMREGQEQPSSSDSKPEKAGAAPDPATKLHVVEGGGPGAS